MLKIEADRFFVLLLCFIISLDKKNKQNWQIFNIHFYTDCINPFCGGGSSAKSAPVLQILSFWVVPISDNSYLYIFLRFFFFQGQKRIEKVLEVYF